MNKRGSETDLRGQLLDRARRTIVAVGQAVGGKEPAAHIQTDASTLLAIGELMATMLEDMTACGGPHCMGRMIDGLKLWVTQDQFNAVRARNAQLEQALHSIARAGDQGEDYDMLIDWRETTVSLRRIARATLDERQA